MNANYYKMLQRKELKKNLIFVTCILLFATLSTYLIYNNFKTKRDEITNLSSISVTYHEQTKGSFVIDKYVPVRDSIGLSKEPYKLTIKNNKNYKVLYKIVLEDNKENTLPKSVIKIGYHSKNIPTRIVNYDDLEDNILLETYLNPFDKEDYTIRFWTTDSDLSKEYDYYFSGKIKVIEEN